MQDNSTSALSSLKVHEEWNLRGKRVTIKMKYVRL